MRANVLDGPQQGRGRDVPDPKILNARDAIVEITSTAICGSDLHLYDGYIPTMRKGDVLGHEFMGEVVEVGPAVIEPRGRRPGGRAVPDRLRRAAATASASCTRCCENSNPNAAIAEKLMGHSPAGIFGYSHLLGGYAGGQAEYARVPFADVGPIKIESDLTDEQVLFLSDILPDRLHGRRHVRHPAGRHGRGLGRRPGRPVRRGQRPSCSARRRVIVIDRFRYRLQMAAGRPAPTTINYDRGRRARRAERD